MYQQNQNGTQYVWNGYSWVPAPQMQQPYAGSYMNTGVNAAPPYAVSAKPLSFTQNLTPEQIKLLTASGGGLDLELNEEDIARAACLHKTADGKGFATTIIDEATSTVRCNICGAEFTMIPHPPATIDQAMKVIEDTAQQSKLMWLDAPADVSKAYFAFLPLMKKVKSVNKVAQGVYNKLTKNMNVQAGREIGGFGALDSLTCGFGAPVAYPTPTPAPGYNAPGMPVAYTHGVAVAPGVTVQQGVGMPMTAPAPNPFDANAVNGGVPGAAPHPYANIVSQYAAPAPTMNNIVPGAGVVPETTSLPGAPVREEVTVANV